MLIYKLVTEHGFSRAEVGRSWGIGRQRASSMAISGERIYRFRMNRMLQRRRLSLLRIQDPDEVERQIQGS